jgi:uncharacterized membrane protein
MVEELVNPNWHVALVHFPLALLMLGTLIELFSFLYRGSSFRTAGRWMILLGALSAVPVALSGLYALGDAMATNNPAAEMGDIWREIQASSPLRGSARGTIEQHGWLMGISTVAGLVVVAAYLACSDRWRTRLYKVFMVLLLGTTLLTSYGAWFAGESVYMLRTAVRPEVVEKPAKAEGVNFLLPPMQLHLLLAGTAFSLAIVSFAITIRRVSGMVDTPPPAPAERSDPMAVLRSLSPDTVFSQVDVPPPSRFWLLAFGVAALASLVGWYLLASESDAWAYVKTSKQSFFKYMWTLIRPEPGEQINRRFLHTIGGGTIILLPLILSMIARWAPRRRGWVVLLSLVLFGVICTQIWVGTLLMWDTPSGSVMRFNSAAPEPRKPTTAPKLATEPAAVPEIRELAPRAVTKPASTVPTTLPTTTPATHP